MIDYTTVIGVDAGHLEHLKTVWPTWCRFKPSLLNNPMVIFFDDSQLMIRDFAFVAERHRNVTAIPWPVDVGLYGDPSIGRFGDAQRGKMLAGFVFVPAEVVETPYWLKIDLDVVATGNDDWVDQKWFDDSPAIVSHPWNYTKPPQSMLQLDAWANQSDIFDLKEQQPLNLHPLPGSDILRHKRIISFCGFFRTDFTKMAAKWAAITMGYGRLPVPSQDGYLFYLATRLGDGVRTVNMKKLGWQQSASLRGVREVANGVMHGK